MVRRYEATLPVSTGIFLTRTSENSSLVSINLKSAAAALISYRNGVFTGDMVLNTATMSESMAQSLDKPLSWWGSGYENTKKIIGNSVMKGTARKLSIIGSLTRVGAAEIAGDTSFDMEPIRAEIIAMDDGIMPGTFHRQFADQVAQALGLENWRNLTPEGANPDFGHANTTLPALLSPP